MCLAIYKPSKAPVDWDALEEGFRCNSHGAGFAVTHSGTLEICKGFFTFDAFREAYLPHADKQSVIHFRLATHGTRGSDMCHPFPVTDELALIHNGVLDIDTSDDKDKSDTWHYVTHILRPLALRDRDFYTDASLKFLGQAAISGSKFVFLRADGDWDIWNQDDGHWNGDIWYSNRSYRLLGFSTWTKDERLTEIVMPDVGESMYYDNLTRGQQWDYEDLLEKGFSADEVDSYIAEYGAYRLRELSREEYDEEQI